MAVEINVDLDSSKAHTKIEALEARLKSVGDSVDIDFGIDDDLKDSIQKITDGLNDLEIDVNYDDLEKAAALKAMLQGDIETDLNVNTDKALKEIQNSLDPPDPGGDGGDGKSSVDHDEQASKFMDTGKRFARFKKKFGAQPRDPGGHFQSKDYISRIIRQQRNGGFSGVSMDRDQLEVTLEGAGFARNLKNKLGEQGYGKIGDPLNVGEYDEWRQNLAQRRMRDMGTHDGLYSQTFEKPDQYDLPSSPWEGREGLSANKRGSMIGRFKKKLKDLVPSMNTFYTLFAAVLPLLLAMGTQLAGVAASMGSVALAGGSILALGLVGHGEDMASSWSKAKEQLSTLKKEMFETFQPTMQTFAPIQARFFEMMPDELDKVARAMQGLTVYSDTLFAAFAGLTDFVADFFGVMIANEGIISQLTMRFGEILGSSILDFFGWLVQEAYDSQNMLVRLGSAFGDLLAGAYEFSKIIARVVMAFAPLAGMFAWLGNFLDNKLVVGILAFVSALGLTIWATTTLVGVTSALVSVWAGGLVTTIIASTKLLAGYIFRTLAAVTANYALAASIANVVAFATMGIGALLGMAAAASAINGMDARMGVDTSGIGASGMPSGATGGYGGGGAGSGTTQTVINQGDTYNMEINGDVDNPTEEGLRDIVQTESGVSVTRGYPTPGA